MRNRERSTYYPVSLSTMWLKDRYDVIDNFIADADAWGFTHVEANSTISKHMLDELALSSFPVSSLHCPCPYRVSSTGAPASDLSLSSTNESEKSEAVYLAKQTIEHASGIGALAVVVHLGEIPVNISLQNTMYSMCQEGKANSTEYRQIRDRLTAQRSSEAAQYMNIAEKSLKELGMYARQWNIILGVETRYYFHQIPDINEMERLLHEVQDDYIGYWHDTGHAEIQQKLGVTSHEEWLVRFNDRIVGTHIHDVIDMTDHYCPGTGTIKWPGLAGRLAQIPIKVCEIGEWNDKINMNGVIPFLKQTCMLTKKSVC
jgi:sugar phosphate isomerase/epimerase